MNANKGRIPVFGAGVCRFCGALTKCRVLNEKYEVAGREEMYSDMTKNCFGVEISLLDGKTSERMVCILCVNKLRQALDFKAQILQREQAYLLNRRNTRLGSKINLKPNGEISSRNSIKFVKKATQSTNYFAVEHVADGIDSDGLDNVLDAELLDEYYALQGLNAAVIDFTPKRLRKLLVWETKRKSAAETEIDHRMESMEYSSPDDGVPLKRIIIKKHSGADSKIKTTSITNKKQSADPDIEKLNQPFIQAANVSSIVEYSYVCPFKNRFNHILCFYCDQYFLDPGLLRKHTSTHNPKDFKPPRYRYTKLDTTRIDCRLCAEKIDDLDRFKRHLVSEHNKNYFLEATDGVLPFKLMENMNKCTICGEEFSYFYGLYKHMNQHFSNYMCENCGMGFMDEISLQKHATTHDGKRYPCSTCGNTFKSEYTRLCHIQRIHKKDEPVSFCTKCEAELVPREKTKHMLEVHGVSPVVSCMGCDQVFNSRRLLTLHVRRAHMNDYRYECHVCHKKFFRRSSLTFHMPTHTGERNFKCKVCEKSYPRLKTLKEHMRIHTNDRRYRCHICGQAFVQNCSLKGHMKSKHPEHGSI